MRRRWSLPVLSAILIAAVPVLPPVAAAGPPGDVHSYLENPQMVGEGQEPHHAGLRQYDDTRQALAADNDVSAGRWTRSLDGAWRIHMSDRPEQVPAGFFAEGYDTSGWRTVSVPHTWQTDGLDHPIFRNIPTEMWPDKPPAVPHDVNPTGAYVRGFDLPADWQGRREFLRFEGVTSGYFVWVNGKYAGYDQGGYSPAEFEITDKLHPGRNTIAVQVHRWSSGAHLEDYDQWRFAGIFRSVNVYSTPRTFVQDIGVRADLDAAYRDGTLGVDVELRRADAGAYRVRATLHDAAGRPVVSTTADVAGETAKLSAPVPHPAKRSDETPNLYTVVVELLDPNGQVSQVTSQPAGFRKIEIRDKQMLVNGKRILVKGVNRAETSARGGRHVTREETWQDVKLMKQLNVNAIRTSHYPSDPSLYDMADRHGMWIDDEVDIETHHHESCPDDCLAERPEWQAAFMDRYIAMVERDKNHPSVFLWDTGNEAGLGKAHFAMADWTRKNEPSRPLYHQSNWPDGDAPFADIAGPRYSTPFKSGDGRPGLEEAVKTTTKPIIMGEYEHAQGNSLGGFREFWDVIRRNPSAQGGFIWDWAEQNIRLPLRTTPDSSPSGILAWLTGMPSSVDGHRGKALSLSGLDDFVEVYRDRRLDEVSTALTADAWVKPAAWTGDFTVLAKGNQYSLRMADAKTLEFSVAGHAARAAVPADWYDNWHRVSGTFDGKTVRLLLDGAVVASADWAGTIGREHFPVNIGRNADSMQEWSTTRMAHGVLDDVRVYHRALTPAELAADPKSNALLALDFDRVDDRGTYLSYGSGMGGVDGVVGPERSLQPETAQLAWVHAPIRFAETPDGVKVTNERAFAGSDDLRFRWKAEEAGRVIASGELPLRLAAGETAVVRHPALPPNPNDIERTVTFQAVQKSATAWASAGSVVAFGQFVNGKQIAGVASPEPGGALDVKQTGDTAVVSGKDFQYRFEKGTLTSMRVRGTELLKGGPALDVWRAPVANEMYSEDASWRKTGLDRLVTSVSDVKIEPGRDEVSVTVRSSASAVPGASLAQTMTYRVSGNGEVRLQHRVDPQGDVRGVPYLPRVGFSLRTPAEFQRFSYYGRGPAENYNDRAEGSPIGVYSSTVDGQYVDYYRPQDYGNHGDVRWATLTDGRTGGLMVSGDLQVAVSPYDDLERAAYPFALQRNPGWNTLHVSNEVSGVSETFHPPLPEYRTRPDGEYAYSVTLRPLSRAEIRDGKPSGPFVCVPDARLSAPSDTIEAGGTATATLTVTNSCQAPLDNPVARTQAPQGWTATVTGTLGRIAPGASASVPVTVTRSPDSPGGSRPVTAEVSSGKVTATASLQFTGMPPAPRGDVAVSKLEFVTAQNGWGPVERDQSNGESSGGDGAPMRIAGITYPTGVGAHAESTVDVYLGGRCTSFTASVGIDDETNGQGLVTFEVHGDGRRRFASAPIAGGTKATEVAVDVTGVRTLSLRVTDGGNGNAWDHADWAAAQLRCSP
ncbi:glycoside hydrolase family 2 TIM barrel-domain containing protein [Amycolatopsis sp. cg5]|uniref:glycoside hydrolase family 2 TIM barrel-domain containing protein n=1 Tax=Amycolatopsis sp. cg5 TaxID=3238802 RepID=UPI0035259B1C